MKLFLSFLLHLSLSLFLPLLCTFSLPPPSPKINKCWWCIWTPSHFTEAARYTLHSTHTGRIVNTHTHTNSLKAQTIHSPPGIYTYIHYTITLFSLFFFTCHLLPPSSLSSLPSLSIYALQCNSLSLSPSIYFFFSFTILCCHFLFLSHPLSLSNFTVASITSVCILCLNS